MKKLLFVIGLLISISITASASEQDSSGQRTVRLSDFISADVAWECCPGVACLNVNKKERMGFAIFVEHTTKGSEVKTCTELESLYDEYEELKSPYYWKHCPGPACPSNL